VGLAAATALALVILAPAFAASTVCFEAEKGELKDEMKKNFKVSDISAKSNKELIKDSSGPGFIGVPEDGEKEKEPIKGSATIKFSVPAAGDYTIWLRAWWMDSCANSTKIQIDDLPAFEIGQDTTYQVWHWVKFKRAMKLSAGAHTMVITNTEDGALVDQLYLTTGGVTPQGKMKPTP
jgi:hypothetical protein